MATINGTNSDDTRNGTSSADTIHGKKGNDTLRGLGGKDKINGDEGNDRLEGGADNDELDGGKDYDTAVYSGSFFQYQIVKSGSKYTVKDLVASRDGTDTLKDVEAIEFSDRTIYLNGRNNDPIAQADSGTTSEDGSVVLNVLGNDVDFDGHSLKITHINGHSISTNKSVNLPGGGKVTLRSDGKLNFDTDDEFDFLDVGETATRTFTYTVKDSKGGTDTATVTLTITGVNDAPKAHGDLALVYEDGSTTIDVLDNDKDPDDTPVITHIDTNGVAAGGNVAISEGQTVTLASGATVTLLGGKLVYDTNGQFDSLDHWQLGGDHFGYTITDDNGASDSTLVGAGSIELVSREGVGTRFIVWIPR